MAGARDPRRLEPPPGPAYPAGHPYDGRPASGLQRFLGGSPLAVLVRLLVLSVLVGAGMALFGLTPGQLLRHLYETVQALIAIGLDTFQDFGAWILAGAVVVVPLWLISRLFAMNR